MRPQRKTQLLCAAIEHLLHILFKGEEHHGTDSAQLVLQNHDVPCIDETSVRSLRHQVTWRTRLSGGLKTSQESLDLTNLTDLVSICADDALRFRSQGRLLCYICGLMSAGTAAISHRDLRGFRNDIFGATRRVPL
jgi:hypothetical protein